MDYGHELRFGTFITPVNGDPQQPVRLAQASEELGYDVVTFQDHPYQPAFLDTWTLMSFVAAATSRIHIAPNVLNLPLRPAPVTARAAASLDLLSGGRFDLGLGAGGFWDAIEAMGGRRLTPGQAVEQLDEAIDVIRGIWDAGNREHFRGGEYYPVDGAKRGPAPAHDIPIWLGALKPRMLRLLGRKADGWLPSLGFLKPGDLRSGNARIDDAASGAGRDPGEIRRMLNIGGDLPAEQLIELALEDGVSTFILVGDDVSAMQRNAEEVIPAVREAVAAERARRGTTPASGRSAAALARRSPQIDYDAIPSSLRGSAVEPGDFEYRSVKSTYLRAGAPGIVLRPRTADEVADAIGFARDHRGVPLGIRSGGHGISGRSTNDGGIVIDLKALSGIDVLDEDARRVRVGAGARWTDVAQALAPHGWALSSGDYGGVGVGGLATAGGVGFLAREHGLTIDHLVAADVVLADGSIVRASADEHPDLFWALRGAGANMGVVTSFDFEADAVAEVGWAQLAFDASDIAGFLTGFGRAQESAPRDTTIFVILHSQGAQVIGRMYGVVDSDVPETIIERLQPFADVAPLVGQQVNIAPYAYIMANASDAAHDGQGEPLFRSGLVDHLDDAVAAAAAVLVRTPGTHWFQIRSVGGAVADVPADATAYAHRSANFSITASGAGTAFDLAWNDLAAHFEGLYLSFESRSDAALLEQAYPPATLDRLREVKRRYDPDGLFRDNFSVLG
ncbi:MULTISPECIES: LLM class flavin-dependent oxidoreductase [unclassified Microbacterium]|uniref:LLM class flavin-dependent oxidoreductase n=1 Tax=unclassified Microbacterium TaxID=2609290 RepID=UPI0012F87E5E|nr:LLM class flavin-dependent oxidoreductase [Microbacterium sp. MAH-37]MVQ42811.1 LLM class flavin-dependent oxidoreductase [Microbacterium sp. MAH-37]